MPIFDQGYKHWSGELSGHTWRWLAITRHGIRTGSKSKILRMVLIAAWVPALVLVFLLCIWGRIEQKSSIVASFIQVINMLLPGVGSEPKHYRVDVWRLCYSYFLRIELFFSMILVLMVGPSLISQDRRFNALPLYFSRPLRRIDYFIGKLGTIVAFLGMVMIVPAVVAYVFGLLFSLDITILRDTFGILLSSIAYGLIISVCTGLLVLALSALSRNSRYVALLWLGIWFLGGIVSTVLQNVDSQQRRYAYYSQIEMPQPPRGRDDASRQQWREWRRAQEEARTKFRLAELDYSKTDWRPLVSFSGNLSRVGQELLQTNETWESISKIQHDEAFRDWLLATYLGPEYPWYWSALVLAGLCGLSACILNLSIKSMDRLK
jgi:ABC-2 type transport system permease protein